ncbi:hypothetical protein SPRG_04227 [Saprolegnia parasitica CBS 223.65]|uniref:Uncharacterized protein n=1 Tax=Saprolegnia parasitica (strain CBS 223.65) TaxID=695850 RepID=A0A067CP67_SAPPC|nr:hypothetical protein SPRG_04227 [Saprolegnia parasitica CBS 223.65]KDO31040.1 hypothetical protein SPRG_04227 [Saprolegnia parasitica CBS 223.65]|eukprot:XP_012198217.1 hypothetical protein SPRG_04227 [Saprolegnia parasitica CBS 223.65]
MDALETAVAMMVRKPDVPRSMVSLAILALQARNDTELEVESLCRERKNAKAAGDRAESQVTAMAKSLAALQADFDASAHGALKAEIELVAKERDALKRRADVLEADVLQMTGQAESMCRDMADYYDEYVLEKQAHNALRTTTMVFAASVAEMEAAHEEEVERLETELQAAIEARDSSRARAATAKKEAEALKATADTAASLKRALDVVTEERNDLKLRVQALEASLHQSTRDIVDVRQHYEGRLEALRQLLPADQRAASAAPDRWVRPVASNLIVPRAAVASQNTAPAPPSQSTAPAPAHRGTAPRLAPRTSRDEAVTRPTKRRLVVAEPPAI